MEKFTHTVQIADETSKNILGIDFLQKYQLHINPRTKEITTLQGFIRTTKL